MEHVPKNTFLFETKIEGLQTGDLQCYVLTWLFHFSCISQKLRQTYIKGGNIQIIFYKKVKRHEGPHGNHYLRAEDYDYKQTLSFEAASQHKQGVFSCLHPEVAPRGGSGWYYNVTK